MKEIITKTPDDLTVGEYADIPVILPKRVFTEFDWKAWYSHKSNKERVIESEDLTE